MCIKSAGQFVVEVVLQLQILLVACNSKLHMQIMVFERINGEIFLENIYIFFYLKDKRIVKYYFQLLQFQLMEHTSTDGTYTN